MNSKQSILSTLSCLLLFCLVTNANAGDPMKCDKKASPPRSKISVEAEDLAPNTIYTIDVTSGSNTASVSVTADWFGNVEVDLDSNRNDILAGATALAPNFIAGDVTATVSKQLGGNVVANFPAVACRIR